MTVSLSMREPRLPPRRPCSYGQLQEFRWFYFQDVGQLSDDLEAGVEGSFFELAQIAAADLGLIGQVVLRHVSFMPHSAQIGRENAPQIHGSSGTSSSIYCTSIY